MSGFNIPRGEKVFGKVCKHHPEANGLRYLMSRGCVPCSLERVATHRKVTQEKSNIPRGETVLGKVCQHHPELMGLRYLSNRACIHCVRFKTSNATATYKKYQNARKAIYDALAGLRAAADELERLGGEDAAASTRAMITKLLNDISGEQNKC